MDLLTLPLMLIALWGMKWNSGGFCSDGFSLEKTKALRGLLALLVVLHHLYLFSPEGYLYVIYDLMGILCVTLFFFLSGYGLEKSARSKPAYEKKILSSRIPSVLIPYLCLTGIYWLGSFIMGDGYTVGQVLAGFGNGFPIVANAWYIHCLLAFYLSFALGQKLFARQFGRKFAMQLAFAAAWVVLCRYLGYPAHWYNAVIAFPGGIFWAQWEPKLRPWLEKRYLLALLGCGCGFLGALAVALVTAGEGIIVPLFWLAMVLFAALVYLILMKITVKNPLLLWLGDISFEIYGIHGFFIYLYRSGLCYVESSLLWGGTVLLSSVISGWGLHKVFQKLMKREK